VKSAKTRVLVVEDHAQTRAGVRDYLLSQGMAVSEASSTADALQLVKQWAPDVVVLDIVIPPFPGEQVDLHHGDGIRAARLIKEHNSQIGIVLLSSHPYYRPEVLDLAGRGYGGLVYLFKGESPADELRNAIQQALEGRLVFDPQVGRGGTHRPDDTSRSLTAQEREKVEHAVSEMDALTQREWDIVKLIAASRTNAGIANELYIAPSSVQTHLSHIYAKVGLGESEQGALFDKRALLTKAYRVYRSRNVRDQR
jgi:DNA-binding NarL/FixJ family response regulator